ncbi:Hypothetical protein A7982_05243 [Minicystis rosea]|nr:Hypothetical protein A7982_05243 [Minicystis rosea]
MRRHPPLTEMIHRRERTIPKLSTSECTWSLIDEPQKSNAETAIFATSRSRAFTCSSSDRRLSSRAIRRISAMRRGAIEGPTRGGKIPWSSSMRSA